MTLFFLTLILLQVPRDAAPNVALHGRVIDSVSGRPIGGAIVEILPPGGSVPLRKVEASESGEFQFRDPPPPAGRLSVSPPPMQATHISRIVPSDGFNGPELVVRLDPALAIEGRVVDEFDDPMSNVQVVVEPVDAGGSVPGAREHFSDGRGMFRVFGLAPGRYHVCVVPERPTGFSTYAPACYSKGDAVLEAIDIRHGVDNPNLTIRLRHTRPTRQPLTDAARGVTIRGRVSDAQAGNGLPRALVSLWPLAGGAPHEVLADHRGQFEIRVPPGPYDLRATAGEFKTTHVATASRPDRAARGRELLILPEDTFGAFELTLTRAAAIEGTVTNTRNTPLSDAIIELIPAGSEAAVPLEPTSTTDDRGRFRLHGVPEGSYKVCARPQSGRPVAEWTYVRGCIPVTATVRAGDTMRVPIYLERSGAYSISGRVVGPGNVLAPGAFAIVSRVGDAVVRTTRVPIGPDGAFSVPALVPGVYEINAMANLDGRPADAVQLAAVRLEIVNANIDGVLLQLSEGVSVRGRVVIDEPGNDRRLQGITVRAVAFGSLRMARPATAETDAEGEFLLRGLFGTNVLRVIAPPGYIVKSIRHAGREINELPTEFDPLLPAEIVLSRTTAQLAGRVLDDLSRPVEDAGVLYFPAEPRRWHAYEGGLRQQSVGGRYRIDGLAGGDYFVIAVRGPRPGWTEKDYAALAPLAERVMLQEGEQRALDLRVVTLGR